jgi:hypothetical protein
MLTLWQANASTTADCHIAPTTDLALVRQLVKEWHSTLPVAPPGWRVGFVVSANDIPVAVAMWGRPVARLEDAEHTLELTRLAHSPDAPLNTGSWALARMRAWIRQNMPDAKRLISYQDADAHYGTIYKADNWRKVYDMQTSHSWTNRSGRTGTERRHRIKWEYHLT